MSIRSVRQAQYARRAGFIFSVYALTNQELATFWSARWLIEILSSVKADIFRTPGRLFRESEMWACVGQMRSTVAQAMVARFLEVVSE